MLGFFKMKPLLLGLFLATPAVAAWMSREPEPPPAAVRQVAYVPHPAESAPIRVPVEVLEKGSAPQWVYVEVSTAAVPEPGLFPLAVVTWAFWVLRRKR